MNQTGVIHKSGFSIQSASPHTMIETKDGAGLSVAQGNLRITTPGAPHMNLGGMMDIRQVNGQNILDVGNLKALDMDGLLVSLDGPIKQVARPETLVTPYEGDMDKLTMLSSVSATNPRFVTLDSKARALYVGPKELTNRNPAQTYIPGARMQIAGASDKGNLQIAPAQLQLNNKWGILATNPDVFEIRAKGNANAAFSAALNGETSLGTFPATFQGINSAEVRGDLEMTDVMRVAGHINDDHTDEIFGIFPQHLKARKSVVLGPHIVLENDVLQVGPPALGATTIHPTARPTIAVTKELQLGPKFKLMDNDGNLVLKDSTTNKTIRTIARLVAPPPLLLVDSPFALQLLSNMAKERIVRISLKPLFKSADTDYAGLTYSLVLNPDNMAAVDTSVVTDPVLVLQTRITPTTGAPPSMRTGNVQIRAVSALGAISPILVIPFEERFFVPPVPIPPTEPIKLEEGQEITIKLQEYFENPNPSALTTAALSLDDAKGREKWTFRVNNNPPTTSPTILLKASNQNTTFNFSIVAINEMGLPSVPLIFVVKEIYVAPPVQTKPLPVKITAGDDEEVTFDMSQHFNDPQQLALTYRVATSNPNSKIQVDGPLLKIKAQNRNVQYPLQIHATNGTKTTAAETIMYMQETYVSPPVPVNSTSNNLPWAPVEIGDTSSVTIDLTSRVRDPQQLPLTFSIVANPSNAKATVSGKTLIVQGQDRNAGPYYIELSAFNGTKRVNFQVQVQEVIWPTPGLAV